MFCDRIAMSLLLLLLLLLSSSAAADNIVVYSNWYFETAHYSEVYLIEVLSLFTILFWQLT